MECIYILPNRNPSKITDQAKAIWIKFISSMEYNNLITMLHFVSQQNVLAIGFYHHHFEMS